jgi:hypothetical protein
MFLIRTYPAKYRPAPHRSTMVNPADRAISTARMGEATEQQPFTAQAQGIRSGSRLPRKDRPSGIGIGDCVHEAQIAAEKILKA